MSSTGVASVLLSFVADRGESERKGQQCRRLGRNSGEVERNS